MSNQMHPVHKFLLAIDKPIPVYNGYNQPFDENTSFLVVYEGGRKETLLLKDLIGRINRHNLCVVKSVFEDCEEEPPLFCTGEEGEGEEDSFVPAEDCAWGFNEQCVAWFKSDKGEVTALIIAPGYRLHAVKDDKTGVFVEDTNRDRIFVEYGGFHPALAFETKVDFFDYVKKRRMNGEYRFKDWDYFLVATAEHNYRTIGQLIKVGWPDFQQLLERYQQNGLDDETCLDEGNFKLSIPWIAYFKKVNKNDNITIMKAFLGVPGYSIQSIVPENEAEGTRPGLNVKDPDDEVFWVSWSAWHDAFAFPNHKAFKKAKENGEIKYKRRGYAGVSKARTKKTAPNPEAKPLQSTAALDVRQAQNLPDEEVMSSLLGVTPLDK